jgi:uncharacterized damage-inducible protein DinB
MKMKSMSPSEQHNVAREFIATCRHHLIQEYYPKIERCVKELSDEEIWWRAHETDNSIGNLLLHLSGNIRQWIISGIGKERDARNRQQEFDERTHIPKQTLLKLFEGTLQEADRVLERFDVSRLTEVRHFQKWDHTCLYAISHVVEHVAQHMGQIIYITKLRKGVDLKFFSL